MDISPAPRGFQGRSTDHDGEPPEPPPPRGCGGLELDCDQAAARAGATAVRPLRWRWSWAVRLHANSPDRSTLPPRWCLTTLAQFANDPAGGAMASVMNHREVVVEGRPEVFVEGRGATVTIAVAIAALKVRSR